jgi:hypothetical protein
MWTICWEDIYGERFWEIVSGEDAMNQRRSELSQSGIAEEEIVVGKII